MPAPSLNPFPLDIGTKQDSWDKRQLLQYLDPSLKITAAELNKIVRALEYLYGNVTVSDYQGNVPATFLRANIDFNDPIGTPITKVRDFINGMPNHVIPNGYEQWFFTNRAVLTNDQGQSTPGGRHFAIIAEYYLLTKKIPPVDGVASIGTGGTQITTADLIKLYERDSRSAEPVEYDLGDIGTSEIWDAANESGPRPTPNTVTTLFRAIQGGTEKIWLYIGGQEEVGTGYPVTDANDYREISSDGSGMDPEPPSSDVRILPYEFIVDEMLTDQARQSMQNIIFVEKAHEDPSLNFPPGETRTYAYYQLRSNATKTESLSDYRLISAPWANETAPELTPDELEGIQNANNLNAANPAATMDDLPPPFDPTQIENAIQDLEDNKQDNLGFTPENVANKGGLSTPSPTTYPTTQEVADALEDKVDKVTTGNQERVYAVGIDNDQKMMSTIEQYISPLETAIVSELTGATYTNNIATMPTGTIDKGRKYIDTSTGDVYEAFEDDHVVKK